MPSHLSSIGFQAESEEQFRDLAETAAQSARPIRTRKGVYLHWCCGSGAELWLQANHRRELIGMNPHFAGTSITRVALTSRLARPDDTDLDGAFQGWADPTEGKPGSGAYPFVFDSPDAACSDGLSLPTEVDVQIAAFAADLALYESDEAFDASQTESAKLASEAFIPSGLFSPDGEPTDPPKALAIIAGHIQDAQERVNSMTNQSFWWVKVRTFGGVFDVVADPELVTAPVVVGGVLSGSFWLTGRIRRRRASGSRGLLRRLFGRP